MNMKDLKFFRKAFKFHSIGISLMTPWKKNILPHSYLKLRFEPLCSTLSKMMCKIPTKKGIPSNFHEFQSKKVHRKIHPKKETLMFECYNLMDSMEWQAIIIEVNVQ
jgi:hypothetical protein